MEQGLLKKIAKAEKLRKTPAFPFSLFVKPDYIESGDLFFEVARSCTAVADKKKFYLEAAETFLMCPEEYNMFRASECYKKLYEALLASDFDSAVSFLCKHADCLEKIEKYMLAGQAYMKTGDMLVEKDKARACLMYSRARDIYAKDPSTPVHLKEAIQKSLGMQLESQDIEGAIKSFELLKAKHSKLCRQMLMFLVGKVDIEDVLEKEEADLMMALANKDKSSGKEALEAFKMNNAMHPVVEKVFNMVIDRMRPENDIC